MDVQTTGTRVGWAVAVTMTKVIPTGFNIQTHLMTYSGQLSEDEARGKAVVEAMKKHPEHQVFTILAAPCTVTKGPEDTGDN